jgi:hypothetical protein
MARKDPEDRARRAAGEISESIWDSYRAILEGTLAAQERNMRLTLNVFESGMETLEAQAELNRRALRELARGMREQREMFEAISRDSADAYEGFLGSLSDYYREVSEEPERDREGRGSRS